MKGQVKFSAFHVWVFLRIIAMGGGGGNTDRHKAQSLDSLNLMGG